MKAIETAKSGLVGVCVAAAPLFGSVALAQSDSLALEEIVVTAQKRQETLGDVPISVSVLGSQILGAAGLDKIEDIQHYVPNLQMTDARAPPARNCKTVLPGMTMLSE